MPTGLIRRGARYALRRRVPKDLICHYGRAEIVRALGTADPKLARRLLPVQWVALDEEFDALRGRSAVRVVPSDLVLQQSKPAVAATRVLDTTWAQLIEQWATERRKGAKARDAHGAVVRWFCERVGEKVISQITKADVLEFKNTLLAEGTTPANVNVKLTRLRTLLNYAYDNDLVGLRPASGIRVHDADAARNRRKPFDAQALKKLFGGPVHRAGERPSGGRGEAAYWIPLLGLYTGARLEEIGQLRPADIRAEDYIRTDGELASAWVIRITSDEEGGLKLKNSGSDRVVPVHPELEQLGFLTFCADALSREQGKLFPELKANVHGRLTAKWGEWFSTYLRNVCGVTDKRIVFHSLRHTFKDNARNSGIAEGVQRQLMGHSAKDVADSYGEGYGLHLLVEGMKQLRIVGFAGQIIGPPQRSSSAS